MAEETEGTSGTVAGQRLCWVGGHPIWRVDAYGSERRRRPTETRRLTRLRPKRQKPKEDAAEEIPGTRTMGMEPATNAWHAGDRTE